MNEAQILEDIKKELGRDHAKLDSKLIFLRESTRFFVEIAEDITKWNQGEGEFVECEGCNRLRREKTRY